jgi:vacuolar-type H+-ATPase subunit H
LVLTTGSEQRGLLATMRTKKKDVRKQASELADRLAPHVEAAREKAGPMIAEAREKAAPMLAEAREKAAPVLTEAREKAAPLLAEARDKTVPAVQEARDRLVTEVVPVLTAALAAASEATEEVRGETKKRGKATVAALKGEVEAPEKKTHRVRTLLIVLGLGGVATFVAKRMSDRQATTAWESAYTPPAPAPTPASSPQAGAHKAGADDEGGASPDVAVADSAAGPHTATTPDNPAEEVDLTKE